MHVMYYSISFFVLLITVILEITIRNNAQNIFKYRLKRYLRDTERFPIDSDGEELEFSEDNLEKHFPTNKFIRTKSEGGISKRSRISDSIRDFDDKSNGALIVIDVDKNNGNDNVNKKSNVYEKVDHNNEDGGYNIILNNNGPNQNEEAKKDDIFKEMQSGSDDMEERFGDFIKTPKRHKRVRVILITPLKTEQGIERNKLPKAEPAKLDNLAEVSRGHLVLSEAEGSDLTERVLSDSARKSELEIDIDKLKHVKEKLKLLNEDDDKEKEDDVKMIINRSNLNRTKDDAISFDKSAMQATENVIKFKLIHNSNQSEPAVIHEKLKIDENGDPARENSKNNRNVENNKNIENNQSIENSKNFEHQANNESFSHEVGFVHHSNESSNKIKIFDNPVNKTEVNKIADVTEDTNNRKHEISNLKTIQQDDSVNKNTEVFNTQDEITKQHEIKIQSPGNTTPLKPPGNPSPEDSLDLMNQQPFNENPTGKSGIQLPNENVSKIESMNLQKSLNENSTKSSSTQQNPLTLLSENQTKSSITLQKPLSANENQTKSSSTLQKPLSANENPTKSSKIHAPSEDVFQRVKGESLIEKHTPTSKSATQPPPTTKGTTPTTTTMKHKNTSEPTKQKNTIFETSTTSHLHSEEGYPRVVPQAKIIDKRKAEAIIEFMNKDPLETWRYHFNTLKSLDLNSTILRSGLVNAGNIERLKGVMRRALEGKDITISIVGGSISAGGGLYKDRGNIDGLYYKGVADWWNKMISPLTGSDMLINNIAIGSIGTDYFSYCVKNHIANESDIVLWELSANDYNRYKMQPTKGARPLERLTRMILELPNNPALLYVNFFKGVDYKSAKVSCPNFEDQGEDIIAHYYKIPSLSWRAMVCNGLIRRDPGYTIENLFSLDEYHPSLRGHAQMSLLLLLHLRHVMRAVLQWAISHDGYIERFEDLIPLPEPLFMGPKYPEPLCWTLITADLSDRISNSLEVKVVRDTGFKLEYATNFPIRFDKVICWKAEVASAQISLQFYIPEKYGQSGNLKRTRSEIAITTHTRWGGSATLWIDDKIDKPIIIKEGRPNDPGKRTQVDSIANDIGPGLHTLNIRSIDGGFCLSSIMIDGS